MKNYEKHIRYHFPELWEDWLTEEEEEEEREEGEKVPFVAFGNEEMASWNETVKEGDMIKCHICKKKHPLEYGTSKGKKSDILGFIKCGKKIYLVSIKDKKIEWPK